MTMPSWPSTLPVPLQDGYGFKETPSFARTQMDAGNARQRRRFLTTPTTVTLKFRLSTAQVGIFETFFEDSLFGGTGWCLMPLYNGQGKAMVQARFTDTPNIGRVQDSSFYDVTAQVEAISMPVAHG
jgi:hypothetical protein